MRKSVAAAVAMLLVGATRAHAHRLDEYLQATTISIGKDRVSAQIRLTPGVAVFPAVLAAIDANADGVISAAEEHSYVERVLRDLSLAVDGDRVMPRLVASRFASIAEMKEGRGDIVIDFDAVVSDGSGNRQLSFENRHLRAISVYLVNALVSRDRDIRITHQNRNYEQSSYQMDYAQASVRTESQFITISSAWLAAAALPLMTPLALLLRRPRRRAPV